MARPREQGRAREGRQIPLMRTRVRRQCAHCFAHLEMYTWSAVCDRCRAKNERERTARARIAFTCSAIRSRAGSSPVSSPSRQLELFEALPPGVPTTPWRQRLPRDTRDPG